MKLKSALCVSLVFWATNAFAEEVWRGPITSLQSVIAADARPAPNGLTNDVMSPPRNVGAGARPTATQARAGTFVFVPSPARRRATLTRLAQDYRSADAEAGNMATVLLTGDGIRQLAGRDGDIIDYAGSLVADLGYRTDNLADAYSAFWLVAWGVANGDPAQEPSPAQAAAVKRQVEAALNLRPKIAQLSPAQKQAMSEILLVQMVMIILQNERNQSTPAERAQFQASVRQTASTFGFNLNAMTLTATGFEPARR